MGVAGHTNQKTHNVSLGLKQDTQHAKRANGRTDGHVDY